MNLATTELKALLSTHAFEQDIPPSIADGLAALLAQDRQIVVVTGKWDGRMSGFLADLCHGISKRSTLLRIKSPLDPEAFYASLAAQLHLPAKGALPVAARVGQRLLLPAPKGRFVLLCEAADAYEEATLEAIRQISNYPVGIVLAGTPRLLRRLAARPLAALRQRVTHQLALSRRGFSANPFWPTVTLLVLGGGGLIYYWLRGEPVTVPPAESPPAPIVHRAPAPPPAPAVEQGEDDTLALRLERELTPR